MQDQIQVLVIDDDEDDYFMLKEALSEIRGKKFLVEWASSYEMGRAILLQNSHDICFLDFRLGGKTGLDLLKDVMAEQCKTPIILLTGYGEHEVDLKAMRVGAADYLVKDQLSPLLLERTVRYAIHRTQSIRALIDRESQIMMQDRLASVGLLASSLAHEIGTPLGVIRGRAEYLELQLKNEPSIKKNVEIIISQIDRVSKLIRSLLNLARGDQIKHAEQVSLKEICSEVVDVMAHEMRKHSIEIRNELVDQTQIKVRAQAGPLHQVILNLLVNSVHAIETATKSGRNDGHYIRLSSADGGANWILSIEDTGCGISEKNLKNIFKPFFTTKDIGVGTGLGLATSFRIVESWGGSMQLKSTENKGTEFKVLIPKV